MMTVSPVSLFRSTLAVLLLSWLAPLASAQVSDALLARLVVAKVLQREGVIDEIEPFRRGSAARIQAAMTQYVEVQNEFLGRTPPRLVALRWALIQYLNETERAAYAKAVRNQHKEGSVTSFGVNNLKCNKLVADAYAHGAGMGLSVGTTWDGPGQGTGWPAQLIDGSKWPPTANRLANPAMNLRSLTNARTLRQPGEPKASPDLGDLIVFPTEGDHGHVGLYLGKNLIISAKNTGIEVGTLEKEKAEHQGIARIRKFNGSGR